MVDKGDYVASARLPDDNPRLQVALEALASTHEGQADDPFLALRRTLGIQLSEPQADDGDADLVPLAGALAALAAEAELTAGLAWARGD
jgi:hypothetical protein